MCVYHRDINTHTHTYTGECKTSSLDAVNDPHVLDEEAGMELELEVRLGILKGRAEDGSGIVGI